MTVIVPAATADIELSERTRERIADGVAANTRKAYGRALAAFTAWCTSHGRSSLPATAETLAEYVAGMADAGRAPSSIEQAIAAIRTAHRVAGHAGAPDTERARLVLRSHRRERAEAGQRATQAPPVTIKSLRRMIEATDAATLTGARDRLLLVLGFALMGRRSELAALHISDVTETDDGLEVLIRASKTDQDAIGAVVAIPFGGRPDTCPVRLLRAWRAALDEHGVTDGRLLRSVNRHGQLGTSLGADAISDVVRAAAVRAELPNAHSYTAHSLRAGGATSAYRNGAPVAVIAAHGRWSPTSPVVHSYVRAEDRWKDNPMAGIGL